MIKVLNCLNKSLSTNMKKKIKAKFFHESETFKEVEYDVVEH